MQFEKIIKSVQQLTNSWDEYSAKDIQKLAKINKCENEIQELKGELKKMHTSLNAPDFLNMNENSDNLYNFIKSQPIPREHKSLSSEQADYGEFVIESEKYNKVISYLTTKTPMRQLASVEHISSNVLELVIQDGEFNSGWVAEREQREVTDNPKLLQKRIPVHELYAQPKATQRLLEDAYVNIEQWLIERLVDSFAKAENQAFIHGDGQNKPRGILTYDTIKKVAANGSEITVEDFLNLINSLDEAYLANATFLMNRRTLTAVQKLQDNNGRFIWNPSISEKSPNTIFGIPVFCSGDMPVVDRDKLAVAIADFNAAYKIVDRQGISVMKDPYTEKPFVKFYATKRVGGDVVNQNAIRLLKF